MADKMNPVREGQHTITAHLVVNDGMKARILQRMPSAARFSDVHKTPDGKVMHAEMNIGDARLMLADVFPGFGCEARRKTLGGSPVVLNLYGKTSTSLFNQAVRPRAPR